MANDNDTSLFQVLAQPEREAKSAPETPKYDEETARKQAEARMKQAAKAAYSGTDASFEADWPSIRSSIKAVRVQRELDSKPSMYNDF